MATPIEAARDSPASRRSPRRAARSRREATSSRPSRSVVRAAVRAAGAELGVVWLREREDLVARAVASASGVAAAEIEGLRARPVDRAPRCCGRSARVGGDADRALRSPLDGRDDAERRARPRARRRRLRRRGRSSVASLADDLAALAVRLCDGREPSTTSRRRSCPSPGDALSAARPTSTPASRIARLAALVSGAEAALVWRTEPRWRRAGRLTRPRRVADECARPLAEEIVRRAPGRVGRDRRRSGTVVTLQLGQPPLGAVQLLFPRRRRRSRTSSAGSPASRCARRTRCARPSARARSALELERSRALLELVSEAISRLSLSHTLETTLERLVGAARRGPRGRLPRRGRAARRPPRPRSLVGPHESVAAGGAHACARPLARPRHRADRGRGAGPRGCSAVRDGRDRGQGSLGDRAAAPRRRPADRAARRLPAAAAGR